VCRKICRHLFLQNDQKSRDNQDETAIACMAQLAMREVFVTGFSPKTSLASHGILFLYYENLRKEFAIHA
jgi:hypothetical protein